MTWNPTSNFDSSTVDTDIDGVSPGSGWGGAWAKAVGLLAVRTAPGGGQGGLCLRSESGAQCKYRRQLDTAYLTTHGGWEMQTDDVTPGDFCGTVLEEGSGNGRCYVQFNGGNIVAFNNGVGYVAVKSGVSNGTWYPIKVQLDAAGQANKYQVSAAADVSAWLTVNGGSLSTGVDHFFFDNSDDITQLYLDDIKDVSGGGGGGSLFRNTSMFGGMQKLSGGIS